MTHLGLMEGRRGAPSQQFVIWERRKELGDCNESLWVPPVPVVRPYVAVSGGVCHRQSRGDLDLRECNQQCLHPSRLALQCLHPSRLALECLSIDACPSEYTSMFLSCPTTPASLQLPTAFVAVPQRTCALSEPSSSAHSAICRSSTHSPLGTPLTLRGGGLRTNGRHRHWRRRHTWGTCRWGDSASTGQSVHARQPARPGEAAGRGRSVTAVSRLPVYLLLYQLCLGCPRVSGAHQQASPASYCVTDVPASAPPTTHLPSHPVRGSKTIPLFLTSDLPSVGPKRSRSSSPVISRAWVQNDSVTPRRPVLSAVALQKAPQPHILSQPLRRLLRTVLCPAFPRNRVVEAPQDAAHRRAALPVGGLVRSDNENVRARSRRRGGVRAS